MRGQGFVVKDKWLSLSGDWLQVREGSGFWMRGLGFGVRDQRLTVGFWVLGVSGEYSGFKD